jgi:N-acetylmuramoyl-L-alanine amidase
MPVSKRVVLIDAGHGGFDPGKMAGEQILEKDINLKIAKKLQTYLEQGGATVIMTRVTDEALAEDKKDDMRSRKEIANTSHGDILVSIHQNSYPDSKVSGYQIFYYNTSDNSKNLANNINNKLKETVNPNNRLLPAANKNYFVLRQTELPAVIVECGFLTNSSDKYNLTTDKYQSKIAWGIYMGIVDYFESLEIS